jgi:hypothetical protein
VPHPLGWGLIRLTFTGWRTSPGAVYAVHPRIRWPAKRQ